MSIIQTFKLNLIPDSAPIVINCDQYDKGTGRLVVKLYEDDIAYTPTGTAVIQGSKPDGHGFAYPATLSGNTVTADLTEQMTAVAGRVRCQVVVTESTGRTGTFVFNLDVQRSALPSDSDMSESDYQIVEQAILNAEGWAVGEHGGFPVGPDDPTYHNNAKYWADMASQYATGGIVFKGSCAFASIPTTGMNNGDMWNITDDFTTDSRFIEGSGIPCVAGTNIVWEDTVSKWDIFSAMKIGSINDLNDVSITTPTDGQALIYDANSGEWINGSGGGGGSSTLAGLTDVTVTTPSDGQLLTYDSNSSQWINAAAGPISDLSDVTVSTPTDGQVLTYDANSSKWINGNGGGGSSTLAGLTDVTLTTPTDGQALVYDSSSSDWINETLSAKYESLYGLIEITSVANDLNDYKTPGTYYKSATDFTTVNAPSNNATCRFILIVKTFYDGNTTEVLQEVYYREGTTTGDISGRWYRFIQYNTNTSSWAYKSWYRDATTSSVTALSDAMKIRFVGLYGTTEITSSDADLNTYTSVGNYYKSATDFSLSHTPSTNATARCFLNVTKLYPTCDDIIEQKILIQAQSGSSTIREWYRTAVKSGGTWTFTSWYRSATSAALDQQAGLWSSAVSCLVGDTTATFTDTSYDSSWTFDAYCDDGTGEPIAISKIEVNASNQAVVTFASALANATDVKLHYWK